MRLNLKKNINVLQTQRSSFATTSSYLTVEIFGESGGESVDVSLQVPWVTFPNVTTTAYQALEKAILYNKDELFLLESKFYGKGGLGYELVGFNNVYEGENEYWKFYVDGEVSIYYGASFYVLSAFSDELGHNTIRFELTKFDASELSDDRHESHPLHSKHPKHTTNKKDVQ